MTTNCVGHHTCEPEFYPASLGEQWTCPECGSEYRAFDVHAELPKRFTKQVPPGTIGWTSHGR